MDDQDKKKEHLIVQMY